MHLGTIVSASVLAACGGGGSATSGSSIAAAAADTAQTLATITTGGTVKVPTNPPVLSPVTPVTPVTPVLPVTPVVLGSVLTDFRVQNTGAAQTNVPFTFGQVFAVGALSPTEGLGTKLADGTTVRLQVDVKATHADGSVRHAVISGVLPALAAGATLKLDLAKSATAGVSAVNPAALVSAGLTGNVTITVDGVKYTASLADALASSTATAWLSGSIASEWFVNAPLKNAAGAIHPMLTARFGVRWYSGLTKQARVEVIVENNKTFSASARNYTYDVNVDVGGRSVYTKTGLTHYHHARWHQYAWWDASRQPAIDLKPNTGYLIASKAISNYDQSITIPDVVLNDLSQTLTAPNTGPMTIGSVVPYMGMTGGRGDIGPLPDYSVQYLLSMDKRARDVMMANADGSGSWSIHYRDESTDLPVRTDNEANKRMSTHPNLQYQGPLPVPRCQVGASCATPFSEDVAHLPSLTYLPYLITGDYFYLEETQFWASANPLGTDPGFNGVGQGLLRWHQVRGQAWGLRTLGHAAYITPDSSPLKAYYTKQVDNNLTFYNQTYVVGNPNKLGAYDGSGDGSMEAAASAPWQDDFFTWSFGYLSELGFTKAQPILEWKAKYSIGRLTAPGFCWIAATAYTLQYRDSVTGKVFDSFDQLYQANFGGAMIRSDGGPFVPGPAGVKYSDLACGSKAQADYLDFINNNYGWPTGKMMGYADSMLGYPANMQPGLAVSVSTGIANSAKAWTVFSNRAAKPDYSKNPQWNIIPR